MNEVGNVEYRAGAQALQLNENKTTLEAIYIQQLSIPAAEKFSKPKLLHETST